MLTLDPDIPGAESHTASVENGSATWKELSPSGTEMSPSDEKIPRQASPSNGDKPQADVFGNETPSSTTTIPKAPPTTPATPKREIKLVTASSSAADWFASGAFSTVASKRDPKTPTSDKAAIVQLEEPSLGSPEPSLDVVGPAPGTENDRPIGLPEDITKSEEGNEQITTGAFSI